MTSAQEGHNGCGTVRDIRTTFARPRRRMKARGLIERLIEWNSINKCRVSHYPLLADYLYPSLGPGGDMRPLARHGHWALKALVTPARVIQPKRIRPRN
ncbi:hypothetical protein PV326_006731 [Microctonus aethiopoides]|nr:hypothetical protein PV326_006731 [Microctonus aethiopoides]